MALVLANNVQAGKQTVTKQTPPKREQSQRDRPVRVCSPTKDCKRKYIFMTINESLTLHKRDEQNCRFSNGRDPNILRLKVILSSDITRTATEGWGWETAMHNIVPILKKRTEKIQSWSPWKKTNPCQKKNRQYILTRRECSSTKSRNLSLQSYHVQHIDMFLKS